MVREDIFISFIHSNDSSRVFVVGFGKSGSDVVVFVVFVVFCLVFCVVLVKWKGVMWCYLRTPRALRGLLACRVGAQRPQLAEAQTHVSLIIACILTPSPFSSLLFSSPLPLPLLVTQYFSFISQRTRNDGYEVAYFIDCRYTPMCWCNLAGILVV